MGRVGFRGGLLRWSYATGGFGEALAGDEGEVDEVLGVLDGVEGGDGEYAFGLFGEGFGVFGGVGVDAGGEGFEVAAELGGLLLEPGLERWGMELVRTQVSDFRLARLRRWSALLKYSEARPRDPP